MIRGKFLSIEDDLQKIFDIRRSVFCSELGETEESVFDGNDDIAMHAVVYNDSGCIAAVGRGIMYGSYCKIGFIAVLPVERGKKYGDFVVRMLCDRAFAAGAAIVRVDARESAVNFYKSIGFDTIPPVAGDNFVSMCIKRENFSSPCAKCGGLTSL